MRSEEKRREEKEVKRREENGLSFVVSHDEGLFGGESMRLSKGEWGEGRNEKTKKRKTKKV